MATKIITAVGNAQLDTAQKKFGTASGLFDGTGDYLTTPDNADFNFGVGKFTIDFWWRPSNLSAFHQFYQQRDAADDFFNINWTTNNRLNIQYIDSATWKIDFWVPFTPSIGVDYHIEVVRDGALEGDWYVFIDGTDGTKTVVTGVFDVTIKDLTSVVTIGQQDGNGYINGHLDEYRVSKGVARHTANFTPPTAEYTTDANTVLLLHMDGADASTSFIDSSIAMIERFFAQII